MKVVSRKGDYTDVVRNSVEFGKGDVTYEGTSETRTALTFSGSVDALPPLASAHEVRLSSVAHGGRNPEIRFRLGVHKEYDVVAAYVVLRTSARSQATS